MRFVFGFLFIITSFLFVQSPAYAATYYVATTGNDSYTTTQAQNPSTPWLTLSGAQTKATSGDIINVSAGTYKPATSYTNFTKAITWNADGAVVVQSAASETVRIANFANPSSTDFVAINGFTFDGEGTKSNGIIISSGSGNVTFNNVTFQNATTTMFSHPNAHGISIVDSTFTMLPTSTAILISSTSGDLLVQGSTFNFPSGSSGIISRSATTGMLTFTENILNGSGSGNMFYFTGGGDVYFNNNNISLTGSIGTVILTSGGSGSFDIKNNVVNYTKSTNETFFFNTGIWTIDIDSNTITSTDPSMVMATISINDQLNPVIQRNTIDSLATEDRGQIVVRSTGTDIGTLRITENTLKSRSNLFIINIGTDLPNAGSGKINGAIIEKNIIYGPVYYNPALISSGCHGIFYSQNQNGMLRYNTIYGAGYGFVIKGTGESYSSGGVYYNKIINSNANSAIRIKGAQAVPVYNNTIYSDSTLTSPLIYVTNYNPDVGQAGGAIVKNNILYCGNCMSIVVDEESTSNFVSENNLVFRDIGTNVGAIGITTYSTFLDWQSAGYDINGINQNPLFLDYVNYDLRLQRTSPARDIGLNLGFTRDFLNTTVPQGGAVDLGAYEYIPLTVTINKTDSQADPTNNPPINYEVIFSESVSDFISEDVSLSGTAGATTATVTGSGATYNVSVTGMTNSGTVVASIQAGLATSGTTGNTNDSSTSDDNSITYDIANPVITSIASSPSLMGAVITWTTNKLSSSKVEYGLTNLYGTSTTEKDLIPGVTQHTVTLSGLSLCTIFHYRVVSTDLASNQVVSTENLFRTLGCIPVSQSSSFTSTPLSNDSELEEVPVLKDVVVQTSSSVTLSFEGVEGDVEHYELEYGTQSGTYTSGIINIGNATSFLLESLLPNTTYYFRVRVVREGSVLGEWSNEISAKTQADDISDNSEIKVEPFEKFKEFARNPVFVAGGIIIITVSLYLLGRKYIKRREY